VAKGLGQYGFRFHRPKVVKKPLEAVKALSERALQQADIQYQASEAAQ